MFSLLALAFIDNEGRKEEVDVLLCFAGDRVDDRPQDVGRLDQLLQDVRLRGQRKSERTHFREEKKSNTSCWATKKFFMHLYKNTF
jgi:hypothetical protein